MASSTATRHYSEVQMTDQQDEMNCVPGFTVPLQEFQKNSNMELLNY